MKKIAVIGSMNMDITAKTERFPKAGETVFGQELRYIPGGKGNNQAVAAARLGADVTMFACVGDDAFGDQLIAEQRRNGVNTEFIRKVPGVSSGIAIITVAESDNTIVVISGANSYVTKEYIDEVKDAITQNDILLLQNEIPFEAVAYAAEVGYSAGMTVILNPAPADGRLSGLIDRVGFLTPNEHEAALLFADETDLDALLAKFSGKVVVTLGADGAAAWIDNIAVRIPARKANVIDTTGAGDTFNGAFAYALANDYPTDKALEFANAAASLSTESFGAQSGMPTAELVKESLRHRTQA